MATSIEQALSKWMNTSKSMLDYDIEIGVISSDTNRQDTYKLGLTNAELMFIHENGSPLRNLPSRPVLQMTINYTLSTLLPTVLDTIYDGIFNHNWSDVNVKTELDKMCIRMENYARDIIYLNDGRLPANAPSTIKAKGDNHPLFDTGQLARSITCRAIKRK